MIVIKIIFLYLIEIAHTVDFPSTGIRLYGISEVFPTCSIAGEIGSARSSFPVDGAAALGFRQAFFEVHQA